VCARGVEMYRESSLDCRRVKLTRRIFALKPTRGEVKTEVQTP